MNPLGPFQVKYSEGTSTMNKNFYWVANNCRQAEDSLESRNRLIASVVRDVIFYPENLFTLCKSEIKEFRYEGDHRQYSFVARNPKVGTWFDHYVLRARKALDLAKKFYDTDQKPAVTEPEILELAKKLQKYDDLCNSLSKSFTEQQWLEAKAAKKEGKEMPAEMQLCGSIIIMKAIVNNVFGACLMGIQTKITYELPHIEFLPASHLDPSLVSLETILNNLESYREWLIENSKVESKEMLLQLDACMVRSAAKLVEAFEPLIRKLILKGQKLFRDIHESNVSKPNLYHQLVKFRAKCELLRTHIKGGREHYETHHNVQAIKIDQTEGIEEMSIQKNEHMSKAYAKIESALDALEIMINNSCVDSLLDL